MQDSPFSKSWHHATAAPSCQRRNLGDLVDLRVGDVVPIEIPELVTVYSDGIPVIRGHYGIRNRHYAVKIHHFVAEEEPPDEPINGATESSDKESAQEE